jgi:hypothetical protein
MAGVEPLAGAAASPRNPLAHSGVYLAVTRGRMVCDSILIRQCAIRPTRRRSRSPERGRPGR